MVNKIQTRDIKHSKTTAWEIDCNSLTLEEALKILNPNNYSIYRMAEKRGAYKRVVMELDNARHKIMALEIIKEYQVDVWLLKQCDYENYIRIRKEAMVSTGQFVNENGVVLEDEIPKEYFDLVKRWIE